MFDTSVVFVLVVSGILSVVAVVVIVNVVDASVVAVFVVSGIVSDVVIVYVYQGCVLTILAAQLIRIIGGTVRVGQRGAVVTIAAGSIVIYMIRIRDIRLGV